jgi:hypothetical protein
MAQNNTETRENQAAQKIAALVVAVDHWLRSSCMKVGFERLNSAFDLFIEAFR